MIERRMILWLFAACWRVLLLIHHGGLSGLDGETFYQVAKSAVDQHRLDVQHLSHVIGPVARLSPHGVRLNSGRTANAFHIGHAA